MWRAYLSVRSTLLLPLTNASSTMRNWQPSDSFYPVATLTIMLKLTSYTIRKEARQRKQTWWAAFHWQAEWWWADRRLWIVVKWLRTTPTGCSIHSIRRWSAAALPRKNWQPLSSDRYCLSSFLSCCLPLISHFSEKTILISRAALPCFMRWLRCSQSLCHSWWNTISSVSISSHLPWRLSSYVCLWTRVQPLSATLRWFLFVQQQ